MKHYGDITKINGYELPIVDVITGGSPCQDLSVAGNRAGLAGERSGLFMEQIRIVKEMREHDKSTGRTGVFIRPRYMVWENVPGAFSSNAGKDFQAVLTEIIRITDPESPDVPLPEKGKWPHSGCLYDDMGRWSVAWRLHDAQFWGVPQRRKRIALVADFGGLSAPEVLFERKGMSGNFESCGEEGEGTAGDIENSTGKAVGADLYNGNVTGNVAASLNASTGGSANHSGPSIMANNPNDSNHFEISYGIEPGAAKRLDPENRINKELSPTLRSNAGDNYPGVVSLKETTNGGRYRLKETEQERAIGVMDTESQAIPCLP